MGSSKCPAEKCQITRTKQRGGDRDMYNLNQLKDLALVERINAVSSAHDQTYTVGKQDAKCAWPLRNYFCSFYLFELKRVCRMVGLCIPNNRLFVVFQF